MLIGYARISTSEQNLDLQLDALKNAGCEQIFQDVASGAKTDRPGLDEAMRQIRKRDTLVVWKLDRLGRSLRHLIDLIESLNQDGVFFQSLQESIDTSSSGGKLIFGIFAALAEFERDLISERTRAGLAAARARGRFGGRPRVMDAKKLSVAKALLADESNSISDVCKIIGVSRSTYYNYLNSISNNKKKENENGSD